MTRWIIALVAMSFLSASAMAGVTGKIVGQIVDKDGSGGLPGANVVVLGAAQCLWCDIRSRR